MSDNYFTPEELAENIADFKALKPQRILVDKLTYDKIAGETVVEGRFTEAGYIEDGVIHSFSIADEDSSGGQTK